MQSERYPPLSRYGVIGNLDTAALVNCDGSVDWLPLPHVESPSVFAAILDADRGGRFQVRPVDPYQSAQRYRRGTNVLSTDFYVPSGRGTLTDWMAFSERTDDPPDVLYRKLACTDGSIDFAADFAPRPNYARSVPEFVETDRGVIARSDETDLLLSGPTSFAVDRHSARTTVSLGAGETAWFALRYGHDGPHDPRTFQDALERTIQAWRTWVHRCDHPSQCIYDGHRHHLVVRSELVLKLLTHTETGSIVAAPTTSLPETVGGTRNWDYRYNWIRDAALTVQALYKLGHVAEASSYFSWLLTHVYEEPASIRPLYGLHGETSTAEETLDHLEGYRGSAPVRVGNDAHDQLQLDVYGELVLAMYETSRYGETITRSDWGALREILDYVVDVWRRPDAGIWEVRTEPRQFVHSKVMCWTALDRGVRIVEETDLEGPVERWRATRAAVRDAVLSRGYDAEQGSFVQAFGGDALDATALLVPIVGFLPFDDPRVQGTIDAIERRLTTDRGLVYRYDGDDGLPGSEGTFVLCSFWLVNALALSGRVDEAEALFDSITSHTSPLGLLSEEIDSESGMLLGNFPQAFSHLGLINSALYLDSATRDRQPGPEPLGSEASSGEISTESRQ